MVTIATDRKPIKLFGLSTDTKPTTIGALVGSESTDALPNGSEFVAMNTAKTYLYDEANKTWHEQ